MTKSRSRLLGLVFAVVVVVVVVLGWYIYGVRDVSDSAAAVSGESVSSREHASATPLFTGASSVGDVGTKGSEPQAVAIPQRVTEGRLDWREVTTKQSAEYWIRQASSAGDPNRRTTAMAVGLACDSLESRNHISAQDFVRTMYSSLAGEAQTRRIRQMDAARTSLLGYCAQLSGSPALQAEMEQVLKQMRKEQSVNSGTAGLPSRAKIMKGGRASQDQVQWAQQALMQPQAYGFVFDRILRSGLISYPGFSALVGEARSLAESLIYWELTGDVDPQSLRNLQVCSLVGICAADLPQFKSESRYHSARTVASIVAQLIATQSWSALGI